MSSPNPNRPNHNPKSDTLDKKQFLAETISAESHAEVDAQVLRLTGVEPKSRLVGRGNVTFIDAQLHQVIETPDDSSVESDEIENYDEQPLDTSAVIEGSRGGEKASDPKDGLVESRDTFSRRPSIPIILKKTEEHGRYLLTADDPEIREIIRRGLEREQKLKSVSVAQRTNLRDLVFTRRFTAFDRTNSPQDISPFHGFFTLFWIGTGLMIVRVAAHNWRTYGNIFGHNELLKMMFGKDFFVMAMTDALLCASTVFAFVLQLLVVYDYLDWNRSGWIIQHVWQTSYLGSAVGWTFYRNWPWTYTIFIVLHSMIFLMKQHSFAAYNGYLSQVYKRKLALHEKSRQLDSLSPISTPTTEKVATAFPNSNHGVRRIKTEQSSQANQPHRRRKARSQPKRSATMPVANLSQEPSEITSMAETLSSGRPLNVEQIKHIKETISAELDSLSTELKGKCSITQNHYPSNLSLRNFAEWTFLPTVVYELEYPRQDRINWSYVAEKTAATFGILGVMQVISQAYIYPLVVETIRMKEAGASVKDRWLETPWVILDLLFPLMLEHLLAWYLIWECVLNVIAELTCFADRGFYGAWWNSVSFADYARDWNKPVHNFLLRHVYYSSISAFHLSRTSAMIVTFLLSACVHELVMFCLFHKIRGYLFMMQLLQLPLAALSRTRHLKDRKVMGNVVFWFGIFVGPSIITGLYLVV